MISTRQIQQALKAAGYDPGPVDGVRGRRTILAIIAFQTACKLAPDGLVGPRTAAILLAGDPALVGTSEADPASAKELRAATTPWFIEAQRLIGVTEDVSDRSNPLLIGWGKDLHCHYADDETPWCGLFVGHCIASQLPGEPLPTNPLGARQWQKFGQRCDPQPGAVMVFWRVSKTDGRGHVGFYVAQDDAGSYHVLGGNQSDAVNVRRVPGDRFIEARWPVTAMPPAGRMVMADATGKVSDREA
ncbi:MAG: hypothetical protein JWL91_184 [Sphingomonas bacterium]|nr:hypothetical protein [Sphingomonas bacterium]